jgi:hypothetical protein
VAAHARIRVLNSYSGVENTVNSRPLGFDQIVLCLSHRLDDSVFREFWEVGQRRSGPDSTASIITHERNVSLKIDSPVSDLFSTEAG